MRLALCLSLMCCAPGQGWSEVLSEPVARSLDVGAGFQLGGAASIAANARTPEPFQPIPPAAPPLLRLPSVSPLAALRTSRGTAELGDITLFGGETEQDGRALYRFGTAVTKGRTTAGMNFTYDDTEALLAQSEVFMGFSVTDNFSVGMSGIFATSDDDLSASVARVGLSAAFGGSDRAFIEGEVATSRDAKPVFGVSLGLQF